MYFDISNFFDGFDVYPVYRREATCPKCGMTYSEFQKSGRLGCAQCYEAFATPIETTLRRIHGNAEHHGKIPAEAGAGLSKKRKAEELKQKIAKAVAAEDYETAASLHKELKNLDS